MRFAANVKCNVHNGEATLRPLACREVGGHRRKVSRRLTWNCRCHRGNCLLRPVFTHKACVHKLGARVLRCTLAPHNNDKCCWFPQSGGQALHSAGWLHLASIFLPFYHTQPNSLGFSVTDGEREGCSGTHLSRVCCTVTEPVCCACVQEGIGVFGFLSEIDGVEQLLFYLIYLWFP